MKGQAQMTRSTMTGQAQETQFTMVLLELARSRNEIPLPKSIAGPGIPLPPEQDTLISPNYQLAIPRKRSAQAVEETEEDEEGANPNTSQEQKTDQQQQPPQRVSFALAAKRPRWESQHEDSSLEIKKIELK
ncbi:transcription initiation factor TFIID subunit 9 [Cinnamomum micranthum f. kanehirae]|uniref:Transcription initiation factor TFIID subunit 9 n=1 Tax=Cinnamomum micranthum f. kanehirae TaxID=337451 RepID=A0A3S3QH36_9MAGN|nr:transcription initiation factor TFIID subunit 9 [Cinnamomum micranthum f. kanehirae]